jgi:hypothetical protein
VAVEVPTAPATNYQLPSTPPPPPFQETAQTAGTSIFGEHLIYSIRIDF